MSAIGSSAHAEGQIVSIQDVNKTIVHQTPYTTEICRDYQTSGDKTGDTLMGGFIGGAIGNNVGDIKDGGALGAILGGMWDTKILMQKVVLVQNVKLLQDTMKKVELYILILFLHLGTTEELIPLSLRNSKLYEKVY